MIPRLKPDLKISDLVSAFSFWKKNSVEKFEEAFAKKAGHMYAVAFPYGRTAMMILLQALGLKNKEIICPAYTCVVVPHAIVFSGNTPVFVDIEDSGFNMDLIAAEKLITKNTGALIATSIFGIPVNLEQLREIKRKHPNLIIIQDCAHSFMADWSGEKVHKEGIAAVFAMNISKHIHSIFGGMITTDNKDLAQKIREESEKTLNPAGLMKSFKRLLYLIAIYPTFFSPIYTLVNFLERHKLLGSLTDQFDQGIVMPTDYKDTMTEIEARVGLSQLERVDEIIENRRKIGAYYQYALKGFKKLKPQSMIEGATYSHFVAITEFRREIMDFCLKRGIQIGQLIEYSVPDLKYYQDLPGTKIDCPKARHICSRTINLPVSCSKKDAEKTIFALNEFFRDRGVLNES